MLNYELSGQNVKPSAVMEKRNIFYQLAGQNVRCERKKGDQLPVWEARWLRVANEKEFHLWSAFNVINLVKFNVVEINTAKINVVRNLMCWRLNAANISLVKLSRGQVQRQI